VSAFQLEEDLVSDMDDEATAAAAEVEEVEVVVGVAVAVEEEDEVFEGAMEDGVVVPYLKKKTKQEVSFAEEAWVEVDDDGADGDDAEEVEEDKHNNCLLILFPSHYQ
jgi:hypothetical protein